MYGAGGTAMCGAARKKKNGKKKERLREKQSRWVLRI
jgi:hypothetical protein